MKKIFALTITILMILGIFCSCTPKTQDKSSSQIATSEIANNSQTQPYLLTDTTKSESYNSAIDAYNQFLSGTIHAQSNNDYIYINELENSSLLSGINHFALFDMNLDGIPELHTKGNTYNIFSFCDKNVIEVYESDAGFDTYLILKKPALMAIKTSTGTMYQYTTIDSALVATTIEFFDGENASTNASYYFNDVAVTREQYEQLSKEYLELSKNPVTVNWYAYTG